MFLSLLLLLCTRQVQTITDGVFEMIGQEPIKRFGGNLKMIENETLKMISNLCFSFCTEYLDKMFIGDEYKQIKASLRREPLRIHLHPCL